MKFQDDVTGNGISSSGSGVVISKSRLPKVRWSVREKMFTVYYWMDGFRQKCYVDCADDDVCKSFKRFQETECYKFLSKWFYISLGVFVSAKKASRSSSHKWTATLKPKKKRTGGSGIGAGGAGGISSEQYEAAYINMRYFAKWNVYTEFATCYKVVCRYKGIKWTDEESRKMFEVVKQNVKC